LRVLFDNCFVEVIDEQGRPCQAGQSGEIVVTTLNNFVMPLIRYRIGDVGIVGDDGGQCLSLRQVTGRTTDVFRTKNETRVDGEYFTHLFYHVEGIRQFQVLQDRIDRVIVRMVLTRSLEQAFYDRVRVRIAHVMGDDTEVLFEMVDEIPKTQTGKYLYTISHV
jgi:phenylacetate-CoA ligase